MLIRIASDLHSEWWNYNKVPKMLNNILPPDPTDKDTVLVLAGDIGTINHYASTIKPVLKELAPRFRKIIYVAGNHEFYGGATWNIDVNNWSDVKIPDNVHILEDNYICIDDVAFIGSTLWTSMDNRNPLAQFHAERSMNDYEQIRYPGSAGPYTTKNIRISAEDTIEKHEKSCQFIFKSIPIFKESMFKTVVVTHHLPSFRSVQKIYEGDLLNHAFASDLDQKIIDSGPDLWVHGHTHSTCDYDLGRTSVICNPFGYHPNQLCKSFMPDLVVEV